MFAGMGVERLAGYLLAAWQTQPVVRLWQRQPMAAQDLDIWIQFAESTLRQARLCQGESQPFDSYSQGPL